MVSLFPSFLRIPNRHLSWGAEAREHAVEKREGVAPADASSCSVTRGSCSPGPSMWSPGKSLLWRQPFLGRSWDRGQSWLLFLEVEPPDTNLRDSGACFQAAALLKNPPAGEDVPGQQPPGSQCSRRERTMHSRRGGGDRHVPLLLATLSHLLRVCPGRCARARSP